MGQFLGLAAFAAFLFGGVALLVRLLVSVRRPEPLSKRTAALPTGRDILMVVLLTLLSRLAVYLIADILHFILYPGEGAGFAQRFANLWVHWDVRHYLGIAGEGYVNEGDDRLRLVFFPLYPLLTAALGRVTGGNLVLSGTLLSLGCACGAAVCLYALTQGLWGREKSILSCCYFLLNPLSLFLGLIYTESLFLFLTLAGLVLRARGHSYTAALCGSLSAFTRMPGVIFAGFFLIDLIEGIRDRKGLRSGLRCLLCMLIVFLGLAGYWGVNLLVTGDPFTYLVYQKENWYQAPGLPWETMENTWHYFLLTAGDPDHLWTWGAQLLFVPLGLCLFLLRQSTLPFDLAAYSYVYLFVILSPTWLLSGPRYLFGLCTLPMLQAGAFKGRKVHCICLAVSALLLLVYIYGFTVAVEVF